ncbi:MAG: UDP-N-acetylmuramate dehydrogenase [Lachnobacterium sp.]|uniref:UDP-N-acetylenolpyruvoylglucosamine reductase n=2 Tax=Lachnobacterium bovis TaxID=140626 RepID=A0A1H3I1F3_9FIRM|nr:UDP-N-acetylmuramate dehydrogenase [Lachnobacterium sp.]SDY20908.1 UDP-N-acetylmuramate dehydrogenase [Lachnobacterium bovis DSM 14045]
MEQIINEIKKYIPEEEIALNEPMKKHTTFRVGGDAEIFVSPSAKEVKKIIEVCNELEVPYHVVGNGSNLLVSDQGLNGVVISVRKNAEYIKLNGDVIIAGAGSSLAKVANFAAKEGLGGLEFAAGIPGTIGGAIVMNAGAFGGEIKDVLVSAKVCTKEGKILEIEAQDLELSYRHSCVLEKEYIVLEATFKLKEADKEEIFAAMDDYKRRRISSQPLNFPSAGSTFKRPKDNFAGKLIEDSGLKGYKIGGAQVSEKHCGFVVNSNAATATDVYELINYVISVVKTKYDVTLEPEVKMMGEF